MILLTVERFSLSWDDFSYRGMNVFKLGFVVLQWDDCPKIGMILLIVG